MDFSDTLPWWSLSTTTLQIMCHFSINNLFETVFSNINDDLIDNICNSLFNFDHNFYIYDDKFTFVDPLDYHLPHLDEVWLREPECHVCPSTC